MYDKQYILLNFYYLNVFSNSSFIFMTIGSFCIRIKIKSINYYQLNRYDIKIKYLLIGQSFYQFYLCLNLASNFIQFNNQQQQRGMSSKPKVVASIIESYTNNNSKQLRSEASDQISQKKFIHRKPTNNFSSIYSSKSKNTSQQRHIIIESPRYMINSPVKKISIIQSINGQDQASKIRQDIKTERKDLLIHQKSIDKSIKSKKINDDSADYYKYWKMKANEYQEQNFNLHRLNSSLQQQNQILKHRLQKLERKLVRTQQPQQAKAFDKNRNYQKLQNYYLAKVDQMSKKISQQQLLIAKQEKKIKELSKYISQNYQLKNILNNMQQKISQMRSVDNRDSRANSIDRLSEHDQKTDYLELPEWNKALYGIKEKKKLMDHPHQHKLTKGRGYY